MHELLVSTHKPAISIGERAHYDNENLTVPSVHIAVHEDGKSYSSIRVIERLLTVNYLLPGFLCRAI